MFDMDKIAMGVVVIPFVAVPIAILFGKIYGRLRDYFCVLAAFLTLLSALYLFPTVSNSPIQKELFTMPVGGGLPVLLNVDFLALIMSSLISLLGFLATLYSIGYMAKYEKLSKYYSFLLIFIGSMNGAVIAGDLFTMFMFWEFMTVAAFFLVIFENADQPIRAGVQYLIMSEAGALCMLASIIAIFSLKGTVSMTVLSDLAFSPGLNSFLLLLFLLGVGVKAGMVPLHTWLPEAHPEAPSPVSALLSGVMIKVGIYMMIRVFWQIFAPVISWSIVLCIVGCVSILVGVMLALVQHDAKRLLAFHSISQIGYMILGIGVGSALGVTGGLFHLLNHAFFKGLLFLCVGSVLYRTGTRDLANLGGLAKEMPVTFITCLIAALSISGVPPFNGFASKWMIYQAVIDSGLRAYPIFLVTAMFGSALTLASFIKVIYSIFLGGKPEELGEVKEVGLSMKIPMIVLALLCIIFGVFPQLPVDGLLRPVVSPQSFVFTGIWSATPATGLLILSLLIGLIIYWIGSIRKVARVTEGFIGGEVMNSGRESRVLGIYFYDTIRSLGLLKKAYSDEGKGYYDIYIQGGRLGGVVTKALKALHTGMLPTYLSWSLLGLVILLILFMGFQVR